MVSRSQNFEPKRRCFRVDSIFPFVALRFSLMRLYKYVFNVSSIVDVFVLARKGVVKGKSGLKPQAPQAHVSSVLCKLTFSQESRCGITSNR